MKGVDLIWKIAFPGYGTVRRQTPRTERRCVKCIHHIVDGNDRKYCRNCPEVARLADAVSKLCATKREGVDDCYQVTGRKMDVCLALLMQLFFAPLTRRERARVQRCRCCHKFSARLVIIVSSRPILRVCFCGIFMFLFLFVCLFYLSYTHRGRLG